MLFLKRKTAE